MGKALGAIVSSLLAAASLGAGPASGTKPRKGMELPAELQAAMTEVPLTHRKIFFWPKQLVPEMLRFDPYRAVDFRQGWITGRSSGSPLVFADGWTFQWVADEHTYQYSFDIVDAQERRWACSCAAASTSRGTFFSGERMGIGIAGHGQGRLACVLQPPEGQVEWRLELGVDLKPGLLPTKTAVGWARHGDDEISITGTERLAKWGRMPGRLVGFVFSAAGRPVAAVDIANKGAVIFGAGLPAELHDPVAAAGSALLLFTDDLDPFPTGNR